MRENEWARIVTELHQVERPAAPSRIHDAVMARIHADRTARARSFARLGRTVDRVDLGLLVAVFGVLCGWFVLVVAVPTLGEVVAHAFSLASVAMSVLWDGANGMQPYLVGLLWGVIGLCVAAITAAVTDGLRGLEV